jgi:hypothetical protein
MSIQPEPPRPNYGNGLKFRRPLPRCAQRGDMTACGYYNAVMFKNQQKFVNENLSTNFQEDSCFFTYAVL